jgi:formamidopyrimidine-DNA glycosylase
MPELPDLTIYKAAIAERCLGQRLDRVRVLTPFLLRSVTPPLDAFASRALRGIDLIGKRFAFEFDDEHFLVVHLMIAGRWFWRDRGAKPKPATLAVFEFPAGELHLTEVSKKKRAALHAVQGRESLRGFDRGGIDPLRASRPEFCAALRRENHTLKRALTDPTLFAGIGNAYSDEILHRARLSPVTLTSRLGDDAVATLHDATIAVLTEWIARLHAEFAGRFPDKVTAFRPEMTAHGKYGEPCRVCGAKIQRIVHAENEANYCPNCQTGGKLLADRALSRLLRGDWPKTAEELEERKRDARAS